jgi:hypothetical protein
MSSTIPLPPRQLLCNRYYRNKHTYKDILEEIGYFLCNGTEKSSTDLHPLLYFLLSFLLSYVSWAPPLQYVLITAVPIIKLFAWGKGDSGGHVLQETTSRQCERTSPSHTSEHGGEGDCVKEGGGGEGERERERALGLLL